MGVEARSTHILFLTEAEALSKRHSYRGSLVNIEVITQGALNSD